MTIRRMGNKTKLKEQWATASKALIRKIEVLTDRNHHFESRELLAGHINVNLQDIYTGLRKAHELLHVGNDAVSLRDKIEPHLENMIKKTFKNADEIIEVL